MTQHQWPNVMDAATFADPLLWPPTPADQALVADTGGTINPARTGAHRMRRRVWSPTPALLGQAATMARREATGRHRAPMHAVTYAHHHAFTPAHCAGTSCFHNHADDTTPRRWSA